MTFDARKIEFIEEVKALAAKFKVGLIGTCDSEGILGEITLFDMEKNDKWHQQLKQDAFNFE